MKKQWGRNGSGNPGRAFAAGNGAAGLSNDISLSGMLCRTSKRIDEMTLLNIKVQLPEADCGSTAAERWIECSGVVVSCERKEPDFFDHPYQLEIFFDHISEKNRLLLAKYVQS